MAQTCHYQLQNDLINTLLRTLYIKYGHSIPPCIMFTRGDTSTTTRVLFTCNTNLSLSTVFSTLRGPPPPRSFVFLPCLFSFHLSTISPVCFGFVSLCREAHSIPQDKGANQCRALGVLVLVPTVKGQYTEGCLILY